MNKHITSLRPYQNDAIKATYASMAEYDRTVLQLPTGAGKSHIAAAIMEHGLQHGKRINFITDRIVLSDQIFERLHENGLPVGVMQGNHPMFNPKKEIQVCSIQTLKARGRKQWPAADLFIVDEAHIQYGAMTQIMETWDNIKYLGLTATPFTRGMGLLWENLVVGITTKELMDMGFLSDYVAYGPNAPDLTNVRRSGADYAANDLEERMNPLTGNIVAHWMEHAKDRKTVAFAPTVAYAEYLAHEFKLQGIDADYVCARDTEDQRFDKMSRYRDGKIQVMVNVDVLTRGFDAPDIGCGILARPTRSLALHIQMLGRCLRAHPDKDYALILDHAGNIERMGFPDDPLPDQLDMGERGENADTPQKDEPMPWNCPMCHSLVPPKTRICPTCGHMARREHEVEVVEGVLKELVKREMPIKQSVYSMLNAVAREKGYKKGWVANQYRELFKVWPRGLSEAGMTPDPKLVDWLEQKRKNYLAHQAIKRKYRRQ